MVKKSRLKRRVGSRRRLFLWLLLLSVLGMATLSRRYLADHAVPVGRNSSPAVSEDARARGTIYDRNLRVLAQTLERVSVYVIPREIEDVPESARRLSEILGMPVAEVVSRMERDSQRVWLQRDIGQDAEEAVVALGLAGVELDRGGSRVYPRQGEASTFIGYAEGKVGYSGVEYYYNRILNQEQIRPGDYPGIDISGGSPAESKAHDLVLSLDMKIQAILARYVQGLGGQGQVSALLLDVKEGQIIAGASLPSYNPNKVRRHQEEISEDLLLQPMVIPDEIRRFLRDASLLQRGWEQGTQGYPWSVVAASVDVGSQLRLFERIQLTTESQVDFAGGQQRLGSPPQFVNTRVPLDFGAVPRIATPLKLLLGMSHLLNGGKKIQPHILEKVAGGSDLREWKYGLFRGASQARNVLPGVISRELQGLLGSVGKSRVLGASELSGTTVSLRRNDHGGSYVRDRMRLVAIPARRPQLILIIVARDAGLDVEEGPSAGPSCQDDMIDKVLPAMVALQEVHQNVADMVQVVVAEERNFKAGASCPPPAGNLVRRVAEPSPRMPELIGMSLRKSLRKLQGMDVQVTVRGTGRVVSQEPQAGVKMVQGERCLLVLKTDSVPEEAGPVDKL